MTVAGLLSLLNGCYVPQVREEQMVKICLYVHVCVAPPMIVGAYMVDCYGSLMFKVERQPTKQLFDRRSCR